VSGQLPRPPDRVERLDGAACADHPAPDLWFSSNPTRRAAARSICGGCAVRAACLTGALRRGERYGTWGGQDLDPANEYPAKRWGAVGQHTEQLALPLAMADDPSLPVRTVAGLLGLPVAQVQAAVDAGELAATSEGSEWRVPLWAIAGYSRGVA